MATAECTKSPKKKIIIFHAVIEQQ